MKQVTTRLLLLVCASLLFATVGSAPARAEQSGEQPGFWDRLTGAGDKAVESPAAGAKPRRSSARTTTR